MNLANLLTRTALLLTLLFPAAVSAQESIDSVPHGYPSLLRIAPGVVLATATSFPMRTVSLFESRDNGASFAASLTIISIRRDINHVIQK